LNGRIDTVQAAILLERLPRVNELIERRRQIAALYDELLAGVVATPHEVPGCRDVFYTYTIRAPRRRDALKSYLEANGIETKIQHHILMPQQAGYRNGVRGEFARARQLLDQILCIPAHEKLSDGQVHYVADCIRSFCRKAAA